MTLQHSLIRALIRIALFLTATLVMVAVYLLVFAFSRPLRRVMVQSWHRLMCHLAGLKVVRHGEPARGGKVLMVGNHVSYLDILALGASMDVTFVAKADVATWPLFGQLARLAQTIFIERNPSKAREQKELLNSRLGGGERLMFFPEGTSTDGQVVQTFKSSLFQVAKSLPDDSDLLVQPVTIAYLRHVDGTPLTTPGEHKYVWFGEMTLPPHLWEVFQLRGAQVDVVFHPPLKASEYASRKDLARASEELTARGLAELRGALPAPEDQKAASG